MPVRPAPAVRRSSIAASLLLAAAAPPLAPAADVVFAGPGGGDDHAALQAALDRAEPGDRVLLPAGDYRLGGAVRARNGVSLVGAGRDATRLQFTGSTTAGGVIEIFGDANNVTLRGFTLDGRGDNGTARQGIRAVDTAGHTFADLRIQNVDRVAGDGAAGDEASVGVRLIRTAGVTVENTEFRDLGLNALRGGAVRASASSANVFRGNVVDRVGRTGFHLADSPDNAIQNNVIRGTGRFEPGPNAGRFAGDGLSIELFGASDRSVVEDNTVDRWISVGGASQNAVRRNTVGSPDGSIDRDGPGLELAGGVDNVFVDNVVNGTTAQTGLFVVTPLGGVLEDSVRNSERAFFGRNTVTGSGDRAVQIDNGQDGNFVRQIYFYDNTFADSEGAADPTAAGVRILARDRGTEAGVRDLTFEDNRITGNDGPGFLIQTAPDALDGVAIVTGNTGDAVNGGGGIDNLDFARNTISNNGGRNDGLASSGYDANNPPLVDIFPANRTVELGRGIRFAADFDDDFGSGDPTAALWDFGEGLPVTGLEPSVTFQTLGERLVTVILFDDTGRGGRAETLINVVPEPGTLLLLAPAAGLALARRRRTPTA